MPDADIREQARAWLLRLVTKPTDAQRAEFERWRRSDPAHDEAFRKVEVVWQATEQPGQRLAVQEAEQLAVYLEAMDRAKSQRKTSRRLAAISVVLAAALGGGLWLERPNLVQNLAADVATDRGERRTVRLPDGSTVLLDADSALAEEYDAGERRVRLIRGAAFFDVIPSQTPFIVAGANGAVRVLGTRFDVRLLEEGGVVTLERGSVAVTIDGRPDGAILKPGQQVRFGASGVGPVENVSVEDALAWHGGRFIFYRARLGDVLDEIGRYRAGRILVTGPTLAEERVTGSFPLADTDAALASLQASVGFRMSTIAGRLTLIRPQDEKSP